MQTNNLVSIIMFFSKSCNKTFGFVVVLLLTSLTTTINSVRPNALTIGGPSLTLRPFPSKTIKAILYKNNGNVPSSDNDPKLRKFLNASINKKLPPTFTPTNWNNISKMGKQSTNDLASTYKYKIDNLQHHSTNIFSIYAYTVVLMLYKIQTWLDRDDGLETIEYYLGFDEETIHLINIAMTEMFLAKCNDKKRNNNNLESLFYYSCDIMHMHQNKSTVKNKFNYFIKLFEIPKTEILKINEDEFKKGLKDTLNETVDKTITTPFRVSIESMKLRILSDASNNEIVNSIKRRKIYSSESKSIQELVESYASESDGIKVNAYHVSILSVLIPDIFGYAYNHFVLLYNLREYEINDNDKNNIENFSKFMSSFISMFMNRFFEFKGQMSQELHDAMYSVKFFLDPSETDADNIRSIYDEEQSSSSDSNSSQVYGEKKSIKNYYNKSERNGVIDNYMKVMMDDTVQKLLATCTGEPLDHWENTRFSKNFYPEEVNNKDGLMKLIRQNNNNSFNVLNVFSSIFSHE